LISDRNFQTTSFELLFTDKLSSPDRSWTCEWFLAVGNCWGWCTTTSVSWSVGNLPDFAAFEAMKVVSLKETFGLRRSRSWKENHSAYEKWKLRRLLCWGPWPNGCGFEVWTLLMAKWFVSGLFSTFLFFFFPHHV